MTQADAKRQRSLPPAVAVSTVAFALRPPPTARLATASVSSGDSRAQPVAAAAAPTAAVTLWLPLVRRTRPPFAGHWALPGGPIPCDETLVDTALRTLRAVVCCAPGYLEQLYSFGSVERSADAQRLVTIAYWALYSEHSFATLKPATSGTPGHAHGSDHDPNVAWFSADTLPPLAFDHADIVAHALDRLRSKTEYSTVAYRFLGQSFTLTQLREVHEAILGQPVDPANFRRQVLTHGHLVATGECTRGARHRPAKLFRFRETQPHHPRSIA